MCTVSIIALDGSSGRFRLACSRDELLARPIALPPAIRQFGERRAVMPIDPKSDGTWVAVNDAGLAVALLNVNRLGGEKLVRRESRGRIVPSLLHCNRVNDAIQAAGRLQPARYPPFRLVIIDGRQWGEVLSDGQRIDVVTRPFDGTPLVFTSSSLGDDLVHLPRRRLFERMVRRTPHRQDEFHLHAWPDRPHLSVNMSRRDARTVSRTVIEVTADAATMGYVADSVARVIRLEQSCIQTT
jgi:hypothetical protein